MKFEIKNIKYPLSGWKIHIYGENEKDSRLVYSSIKDLILENNFSCKIALQTFFEVTHKQKQEGKAVTVYFPPEVISENKLEKIIQGLKKDLEKINYKKDKQIFGDKKLSDSIYYRYELNIPLVKEGFGERAFDVHYRKSEGNYNIENNPDPFESIKI